MRKERRHIHLRAGDSALIKRLHPDIPVNSVIRMLVSNYIDRRRDKLPPLPEIEIQI